MKSKWQILTLAACVAALAGCGSDDGNPAGPSNPGGSGSAAMTATLDGQAWTGVVVQAVRQGGVVGIGGSNANAAVAIGIGFVETATGTGTYTIGPGTASTGTVSDGTDAWTAIGDMGSGTITVTTLTTTRVAGTFSFTAPGSPGTNPATRQVTNGTFDAEF